MSCVCWNARYEIQSARALYIHIPFCSSKCFYCDFPSWATDKHDPLIATYIASLIQQIEVVQSLGLLDEMTTIYVGGGTPSVAGPLLKDLLRAAIGSSGVCEVSCEANPESLDEQVVQALVDGGATRVSLGIQSLNNHELALLGRKHTAEQAQQALKKAQEAGLICSCDLMCGIPAQTTYSWQSTLERVIELGPKHVSVYPLTIEEGTAFGVRVARGTMDEPDEDKQADFMLMAADMLAQAGFNRYEVASYAVPGAQCKHNMAYWTGEPYIGLGTGAASLLTPAAYECLRKRAPQLPEMPSSAKRVRLEVRSGRKELAKEADFSSMHFSVEFLDLQQAVAEDLMLAMRKTEGASKQLLSFADEALDSSALAQTIERVENNGLAKMCPDGSLVTTSRGWLLGNALYGAMWELSTGTIEDRKC